MNWLNQLLSPAQGTDTAAWNADAVYVDVRSPAEFASGHVEGALNIPLDQFTQKYATALPDKAQQIVVYCQSGGRSGQAAQFLKQQQYTDIVNGINAPSVARKTQRAIV
jgi:phage shock protein E